MSKQYSNGDAVNMLNSVTRMLRGTDKLPVQFSYALLRNKNMLEKIVTEMNETLERETPEFSPVLESWNHLRDEMIPDVSLLTPAKIQEYEMACQKTLKDNSGWEKLYRVRTDAVEKLRAGPAYFEPYSLAFAQFPEQMAPADVMELEFMIAD